MIYTYAFIEWLIGCLLLLMLVLMLVTVPVLRIHSHFAERKAKKKRTTNYTCKKALDDTTLVEINNAIRELGWDRKYVTILKWSIEGYLIHGIPIGERLLLRHTDLFPASLTIEKDIEILVCAIRMDDDEIRMLPKVAYTPDTPFPLDEFYTSLAYTWERFCSNEGACLDLLNQIEGKRLLAERFSIVDSAE